MPIIPPAGPNPATTFDPARSGCASGPLRIALVNLMPLKHATEQQFRCLLDVAHRDVELHLVVPPGHRSRHTDPRHIADAYTPWSELQARRVDGLIVTGAPVEHLEFSEVDYWPWFRTLADWANVHVRHSLFICWAGQAALHHRYGIAKRPLPTKAFGVWPQKVLDRSHPLMRGLPAEFPTPVSRHTEVAAADIVGRGLSIVATSPASGLAIVDDRAFGATYMFNHIEYDARSLHEEFVRDRAAGKAIALPHDYYRCGFMVPPGPAPWRGAARRLFANWLDLLADGCEERRAA